MATYSEGCSAVGGFSYAKYFTLYIEIICSQAISKDLTPKLLKSYLEKLKQIYFLRDEPSQKPY